MNSNATEAYAFTFYLIYDETFYLIVYISQEIHLTIFPYFLVQCGNFPDRTRMIVNFYFQINFLSYISPPTTYSNEIILRLFHGILSLFLEIRRIHLSKNNFTSELKLN